MEIRFQIIALTETRRIADSPIPQNLEINGYTLISNSTEASAGGTAIYVCNSLSYRYREDLATKMYHSKQLKPNFIEILGQEKKYGCRHPGMSINDFTKLYFSSISGNIKKEKKIVLLEDFNINLLDFNEKREIGKFVAIAASHNLNTNSNNRYG